MRSPRASAVIVALSTLVAIVTISAVTSQLAPLDRAGAVLPDGPITIDAPEPAAETVEETTPAVEEPEPGDDLPGGTNQDATAGHATVVVPAPAETVPTEPEPEPEPEPAPAPAPAGPPVSPGNSGNAPGRTGEPGDPATEQGKP